MNESQKFVSTLGEPNLVSILMFFFFVAITLYITYWAAKRLKPLQSFMQPDEASLVFKMVLR
jgi:hypothetical protein